MTFNTEKVQITIKQALSAAWFRRLWSCYSDKVAVASCRVRVDFLVEGPYFLCEALGYIDDSLRGNHSYRAFDFIRMT